MLFLEGVHSLQGRERVGNLESSLRPSPSPGRKPGCLGTSQAPFHRTLSLAPEATVPSMLDFPLAPGPCLFSPGLEPGPWRRFPGVAQKPCTSGYFHGFRRWRGNDNVLSPKSNYQGCF